MKHEKKQKKTHNISDTIHQVCSSTRNVGGDRGLLHNLVFLFQVKNGCLEKVKAWNISGAMPPIFFILSQNVWENNGILNNNYWMILTS